MGKSNTEIAAWLQINVETAKKSRRTILKKLKCDNLTAAVFVSIQQGTIQPSTFLNDEAIKKQYLSHDE